MFGFRRKRNQEILQNYKEVKTKGFDFDRIALFFHHTDKADAHQVVSEATLQDLDFEELFMYMDRTCSVLGQQYLYYTLRTVPKNKVRITYYENVIKFFRQNPEIEKSSVIQLTRLNKSGAYFLQRLIYGDSIQKPKWYWAIPLLSGLAVTAAILSLIYPVVLLILLPVVFINNIIHYWNKNNVLEYSNTIPQLLVLHKVAKEMLRSGVILDDKDQIEKSNKVIGTIARTAAYFKWESKLSDEIGQVVEFIMDLIKSSFLVEPILFFELIRHIQLKKSEILDVFRGVAQVDVALSIASFREALPYYSFPEITDCQKFLQASDAYHPLTSSPVANSIDLSGGKSVLISGSNMSGKTTFIRTIGINAILSQTINTACAKAIIMPRLKIHSAIRISDNLLDDTSYYFEEMKHVKRMVEESEGTDRNLFLLDELFKGTNTVERISSGKAILSYLSRNLNIVFASTHDIELADLVNDKYSNFHFSDFIKDDVLKFDYKLREGKASKTNAIKILEINKFPKIITDEAKVIAEKIRESKKRK